MPKPVRGFKKGMEDNKKKAIVREYWKMQKGPKSRNPNYSRIAIPYRDFQNKMTPLKKAQQEYEARKAKREQLKEFQKQKRQEKEEAIKKYLKKKQDNFKKISKKTKYGQPVMSGRIEVLLEKIQSSISSEQK
ncbi:thyroid transcription factor 1-associated protein 26-like [Uloborus diversus]|uniref:thyroid transcription factor 1-associated protein 26-like n=1 Tax=Uloborus diversus TaxID=327109 RepID=UPI002408FDD4|nr:thyroid transcription factor 1-associated protein 26-like [Uloborus diversus]